MLERAVVVRLFAYFRHELAIEDVVLLI